MVSRISFSPFSIGENPEKSYIIATGFPRTPAVSGVDFGRSPTGTAFFLKKIIQNTNAIIINIISKKSSSNKNTDFICTFFELSYSTMNKKRKHDLKMGAKISEARRQIGITQTEFAEKLDVSQQLVACWERNANYPTSEKLPEVSRVLGISVDELLGIKESQHTKKGPQSQVEKSFAKVAKLSKRQQGKILAVVDTMLTVS